MPSINHSPVHSDPDICGGTLVFRGTRVFAQTLLDYMVDGEGLENFLEDFPSVERDDACEFLKLTYERVILDENMPVRFRTRLSEFDVVTVRFQGWSGILNGELIRLIDGKFDILITGDKNLRYQQNNKERRIAIIEVPSTRPRILEQVRDEIVAAIRIVSEGEYLKIQYPAL